MVTKEQILNLGSYEEIIHNSDIKKDLFFGIKFHVHNPPKHLKKVGEYPPGVVEVTFSKGKKGNEFFLKRFELYDIYSRPYFFHYKNSQGGYSLKWTGYEKLKKREKRAIQNNPPKNFLFSINPILYELEVDDDKDKRDNFGKRSKNLDLYLGALNFAEEEIQYIFRNLSFIGPLRNPLQRFYEIAGEIPRTVGPKGENTHSLIRKYFPTLKKKLNFWVKKFGFGNSIKIKNISDDIFSLYFEEKNFKTNISDAGFGASQVLPLVVQALTAREGSLTIAEQPEIHLNPRLQCELADLFVEMANNDKRVLVETHSEHLLLRLRALVAKGTIKPEQIALYFVEKAEGGSSIKPIPIRKNGHIQKEDWPSGFFGDSLREAFILAAEQSKTQGKK